MSGTAVQHIAVSRPLLALLQCLADAPLGVPAERPGALVGWVEREGQARGRAGVGRYGDDSPARPGDVQALERDGAQGHAGAQGDVHDAERPVGQREPRGRGMSRATPSAACSPTATTAVAPTPTSTCPASRGCTWAGRCRSPGTSPTNWQRSRTWHRLGPTVSPADETTRRPGGALLRGGVFACTVTARLGSLWAPPARTPWGPLP